MTHTSTAHPPHRLSRWTLSACTLALLAACGGGAGPSDVDTAATAELAPVAGTVTDSTMLQVDAATLPADAAVLEAQPAFHAAPVLLNAPDDSDALDPAASARRAPSTQAVPAALAGLSTRRLTVDALDNASRAHALGARGALPDGTATAMATGSAVSTYTPAQIRAAYGLPALPAAGATLSATQRAQLGAGQTIYIVNAMHNPNVAAELAAFNQKFGLPTCSTKAVATNASLPLAAASPTAGCELAVVYTNAAGAMAATAPAYNAGWATEIALDVQWAHATAPLARIVLLEAPDATLNGLLGAIKLANRMGPGVVSMSFGANEGNYTAQVDAAFTGANMSYLAATGDSGAAVSWPSVSPNVVAVGGTRLNYTGSGPRSEAGWSGTGGGTSAYTALPGYQTAAVPGLSGVGRRTVADVAFNADPSTGQFVAVMSPGSSTVNWISAGGTSLSTPQWAGLLAVANALRAQAAKPMLGAVHAVLYGQIGAVPAAYAGAFADIVSGKHGTCTTCTARTGYDPLAGLGTPNAGSLLAALGGASTTPVAAPPVATAPVVSAAAISGRPGVALSFTAAVSAGNPVTFSLGGAPSDMSISGAGVVSWAKPVAGNYSVTVVAKDSKTGLSGQGVFTVKIAAAGPVITASAITGVAGKALAGSFSVASAGAASMSISISGAPAGMSFAMSGANVAVKWTSPVKGSYSLKIAVVDSAGLSASATLPITITAK